MRGWPNDRIGEFPEFPSFTNALTNALCTFRKTQEIVDNPSHPSQSLEDYTWPWSAMVNRLLCHFPGRELQIQTRFNIYIVLTIISTNISLCNDTAIHFHSFSFRISFIVVELTFIHPSYHEHPPDLFGRWVQVVASSSNIGDEQLMAFTVCVYIYMYIRTYIHCTCHNLSWTFLSTIIIIIHVYFFIMVYNGL